MYGKKMGPRPLSQKAKEMSKMRKAAAKKVGKKKTKGYGS